MVGRAIVPVLLSLGCAGSAWANDSLAVEVTNASGNPVVVNNGQAVGTIQLLYTVNATEFPLGEFATFDVSWLVSRNEKKPTNYGSGIQFRLEQSQQGGNVDLAPSPETFSLTTAGQSGISRVTVSIAPDKSGNLPSSADGTDLVGNLKLDAGSSVGTVTNIQVHIRLVHPTTCLKLYTFVTDQDFTLGILETTSVKVQNRTGRVTSSTPGQFSDNVLIANTCAVDQSFDLKVGLDRSFSAKPNGNPVKTYNAAGEFDSASFNAIRVGDGSPNGTNLCLQNVTVPAGTSFLATVHSELADGLSQAGLPGDGDFNFTATVHQTINTGCTGTLDPLVSPNPATFTLPFTID